MMAICSNRLPCMFNHFIHIAFLDLLDVNTLELARQLTLAFSKVLRGIQVRGYNNIVIVHWILVATNYDNVVYKIIAKGIVVICLEREIKI